MEIYNPEGKRPREWTYVPTPVEPEPTCDYKWKWFKSWMAPPLGIACGLLLFCPLFWIAALLFSIASLTSWNPSHRKDA